MQSPSSQPHLFSPLPLRSITVRNRIMVSPMCQYSSENGFANDWHFVHLGSRAVGGAGIVMAEATAVEARGRISPEDLGIWDDAHVAPLARITAFIKAQGAVPGVQLAHAGRKASTYRPWSGSGAVPLDAGGWQVVSASAQPFSPTFPMPQALILDEIKAVIAAFVAAAQRALAAGFEIIEIHAAHGYLIHQFLSPLSNERTDAYGGSLTNRMRLGLEIAEAVRGVWPEQLPLLTRISATDWVEGGWDVEQSIEFARNLATRGVDLIDVSSGGTSLAAKIPVGPGYQVPLAEQIRQGANLATAAVGLITEPAQADAIIRLGQADLVALARAELRDPYWPFHAAHTLGHDIAWPAQYERAKPVRQ